MGLNFDFCVTVQQFCSNDRETLIAPGGKLDPGFSLDQSYRFSSYYVNPALNTIVLFKINEIKNLNQSK